jgi:hypothetical protein
VFKNNKEVPKALKTDNFYFLCINVELMLKSFFVVVFLFFGGAEV